MFRSLQLKFLLLLLGVVAVALSGTIVLRELMLRDFSEYLEGDTEDRVYWITADLEGAYERNGGWKGDLQAQDALWALTLGFEIRLLDHEGKEVIDTDRAIQNASPIIRKKLDALSEGRGASKTGQFTPYPLFLHGRPIGTLEARVLQPAKETLFVRRADRFLLLSIVIVGGLAILVSVVFARRLTRPIKELAVATAAIKQGDLKKRVAAPRRDELGDLAASFNRMAHALETQESLRRTLIADVAHELRTPLGVMRGELEGMMDGLIPNDEKRLQSLYEETGRLSHMVEGIEELNQAEASILSLARKPIDGVQFFQNIVERFRKRFQEKNVTLDFSCDHGVRVYADPERLSQIALNLLSNALRATPGGGKVSLIVTSGRDGASVTVEDNGAGIKEEELPFIFERFYKGAGGGLGIGLTIVKELVEAHGGTIEVRSAPGKGSAFIMWLPNGDGVHNSS